MNTLNNTLLELKEISKTYGEKGRVTLTVEEVQDLIAGAMPGTAAKQRRVVHSV